MIRPVGFLVPRTLGRAGRALAIAAAALGLVTASALTATASASAPASAPHTASATDAHQSPATPVPTTGGALGPNVIVFDPTMAQASIQSTLDTIAAQQVPNQFGTERYALLFKPGTYGSVANPLVFQIGYYTSVAGLGPTPDRTVINGSLDVYNQCLGSQTNCNATDNFWRSVTNLTINVAGGNGCQADTEFWAASQASPLRRVVVNGNVSLMDYCDGSPDYASGGFIADSRFTGGTVINGSQQQYITRDTDLDGWTNGVWNQVFCGDPGAPAQSFAANSGDPGGPAPYTTLATCPVTKEAPFLYLDDSGQYRVFVPSLQKSSSGPTWAAGATPGTSLPLSKFYVVTPASTVAQINTALLLGDDLLFTPGVYSVPRTIHVLWPNTQIIGLGFPTLVPTGGNVTMDVADTGGTTLSGLIFDAGKTKSPTLLDVAPLPFPTSHAENPISVDDVFFRVGGATAGTVTDAFIDNSDDSILDDVWIWRADHGAGAGTWTSDQADTGLTVNGDGVTAYGLAVEHFQKNETVWNGQRGTVIFFQNENPYEVPNQASWMASKTQKGYPAFLVGDRVKSFQGYGMGSYTFFNQGVDIQNSMAFQSPSTPGVQFHDILTVFLTGSGGIQSVINGNGAAVDSAFVGPSDIVSYP